MVNEFVPYYSILQIISKFTCFIVKIMNLWKTVFKLNANCESKRLRASQFFLFINFNSKFAIKILYKSNTQTVNQIIHKIDIKNGCITFLLEHHSEKQEILTLTFVSLDFSVVFDFIASFFPYVLLNFRVFFRRFFLPPRKPAKCALFE